MSFLRQLVDEINRVRENPKSFIERLEKYKGYFNGDLLKLPNLNYAFKTLEGAAPYDECIKYLRTADTAPRLVPSKGLTGIADELMKVVLKDYNKIGSVDMTALKNKYGTASGYFNRIVQYGGTTPEQIVIHLLVCDGDKNRRQREAIFNKNVKRIGVASADHESFSRATIIILVNSFEAKNNSDDSENYGGPSFEPPKKYEPEPPKKYEPPPKKYEPPPKKYEPPPKKYEPEPQKKYEPPPKKYEPPPKKYEPPPKKYEPEPPKKYEPPPKKYEPPQKKYEPEPPKKYEPPPKKYEPEPPKKYEPPQKKYEPEPPKKYEPPQKKYEPEPPKKYEPPPKKYEPPKKEDHSYNQEYHKKVEIKASELPKNDKKPEFEHTNKNSEGFKSLRDALAKNMAHRDKPSESEKTSEPIKVIKSDAMKNMLAAMNAHFEESNNDSSQPEPLTVIEGGGPPLPGEGGPETSSFVPPPPPPPPPPPAFDPTKVIKRPNKPPPKKAPETPSQPQSGNKPSSYVSKGPSLKEQLMKVHLKKVGK